MGNKLSDKKSSASQAQGNTNAFVRALKRIFVFNAGYKLLAMVLSAAIWLIAVGLGG